MREKTKRDLVVCLTEQEQCPIPTGYRRRRPGMAFDPETFLSRYADAFNARDPEALRSFFALDDPRFAVFEDFSGKLFDGEAYSAILEAVFDATAEIAFELLRCDGFG